MKDFAVNILDRSGEHFISYCGPILAQAAKLDDERKAAKLLGDFYPQGGGWDPFHGFVGGKDYSLKYSGDPTLRPHALITYGEEVVAFYDSCWVAVWQKDGTFEVCRMD